MARGGAEPVIELSRLAEYLPRCRWFGGKTREIRQLACYDRFELPPAAGNVELLLIRVEYVTGEPDCYVVPLASVSPATAATIPGTAVVATLEGDTAEPRTVCDALALPSFATWLLASIVEQQVLTGSAGGTLQAARGESCPLTSAAAAAAWEPKLSAAEQSNTSIRYGQGCLLKVIRRLMPGRNPELEFACVFASQSQFTQYAPYWGALEYVPGQASSSDVVPQTVAILQGWVPHEGDAWTYALGQASDFLAAVAEDRAMPPQFSNRLCEASEAALAEAAAERLGPLAQQAALLGQRTAEMHQALSNVHHDPAFAPEALTPADQQSLLVHLRSQASAMLVLLERQLPALPVTTQLAARQLLSRQSVLAEHIERLSAAVAEGQKIRCHGDYHLGQVLFTGHDFVIIDFEGPPLLAMAERRRKRSPLSDVAGMVRSFHYAAHYALQQYCLAPERATWHATLQPWAHAWYRWTSTAFLHAWRTTSGGAAFLPTRSESLQQTFELFLLDKALYELGYELNHRPTWVGVPLSGLLELLDSPEHEE
jgi:maltose alpha-D-glucosyltransferase/alpha-amylase